MKRIYALLVLVFLAPSAGFACSFDTDCMPGSKCSKASGSMYGVCVGGIFPGNRNDRQPVKAPLDLGRLNWRPIFDRILDLVAHHRCLCG